MAHPYNLWNGDAAARYRQDELAGRIPDPPWEARLWRFRFDVRNLVSPAAATSQEVDLTDSADISNAKPFPAYMWLQHAHVIVVEDFAGGSVSALTLQLGDTGDPNGLLTASSAFTGVAPAILRTTAAAQYALRNEAAFVPTVTLTATGDNIDALVAGIADICIPIIPIFPSLEFEQ